MRELSLSEFGLERVADACARKGWAAKTVQNWIGKGLLPAVVLGTGRGATYLVRIEDVDAFEPPPRGRPPKQAPKKPARRSARKK
jgi:hypothetical protein